MSRILEAMQRAEQERRGGAVQLCLADIMQPAAPTVAPLPPFPTLQYQETTQHPRASMATHEHAAERFRLLRYKLETRRRQRDMRILLVSSAVPGEGKTMVASNLAETLAQGGGRVLLIDADMRRPGAHVALGLPLLPGLAQALEGVADWRSLARTIEPFHFCFLAAGQCPPNPATLLQFPQLKSILHQASEAFDWVILDSPPLVAFADSLYLAEVSHGVLMVARQHFTPIQEYQRALDMLQGFPLVGVVLNAVDAGESGSYYSYYYRGAQPRPQADAIASTPSQEAAA